jgi:hypothetical protein
LNEEVTRRVSVRTIQLRGENGRVREPEELDGIIDGLTEEAIADGRRVLLHVVAHSKTGVHAPRLQLARRLERQHPGQVDVVIDAAQGRISRRGLQEALRAGWLVLFTGSKFYGGPPFSSALLMPRVWNPEYRRMQPIPHEFGDYFSRMEFPQSWAGHVERLAPRFNLGLLLRWTSAVQALQAYYSVPGEARLAVLRRFEEYVPHALMESAHLELDSVKPVLFPAGAERLLESKTTVFPFRVRVGNAAQGTFLQKDPLRQVARWLNRDLSSSAPEADAATRQGLKLSYHIGQPVFDGDLEHAAVLRLALGAALVTSVGADRHGGSTLADRLAWLERQVDGAVAKLEWIAANYDHLAQRLG